MKKLYFLFFLATCINSYAQRYVSYVFPKLDSTIGAKYGIAMNATGQSQNLLYDFYSPAGDTIAKRPLIIYIHGGSYTSGTRTLRSIKIICRRMASKGYAVANIDYRLDPDFQIYNSTTDRRAMTDAMHDAKQAIRYFKANAIQFKLDTGKIFIGGESAGAMTAMMASFVDKQAEMSTYPKANPDNPVGSMSNQAYSNKVAGTLCLCGMLMNTDAMETSANPPILWAHGTKDNLIPVSLAENVIKRANQIRLPIQSKHYYGATHCPWIFGLPNWQKYLDSTESEITKFLYPKVSTTLGVNDVFDSQIDFQLFPNPVIDKVNINFRNTYSLVSIRMISSMGQISQSENFTNASKIALNTEHLEQGIYMLKIQLDNKYEVVHKIVVARK